MAKAEVSKETVTREGVEALLKHWEFPFPLTDFSVLFGGYSGTSVKVVGADGEKFVLKICHGYSRDDVEAQARCAVYARAGGFGGACTACALRGKPATFSVERDGDKTPAMLLTWVDGLAADKVIAAGAVAREAVLHAVGEGLGQLHCVAPPTGWDAVLPSLRTIEEGGGCDLRLHLSGEIASIFASAKALKGHAFLPFYERELASMRAAYNASGLPTGVLHADPFLDNVLVSPSSGALAGFVDLEDVCLGPLLFDVACCACAACFDADTGALDLGRFRALMGGYSAARPLAAQERAVFVAFMRLTMLCNCAWRFKNFNVDHPELVSMKDAHVELQQRIEALHEKGNVDRLQACLAELPTETEEELAARRRRAAAGAAAAAAAPASTPAARPADAAYRAAATAAAEHIGLGGQALIVLSVGVLCHRLLWGAFFTARSAR